MPKGFPFSDPRTSSVQQQSGIVHAASPSPHINLPTDLVGNGGSAKPLKAAPRVVHDEEAATDWEICHVVDSEDEAGSSEDEHARELI